MVDPDFINDINNPDSHRSFTPSGLQQDSEERNEIDDDEDEDSSPTNLIIGPSSETMRFTMHEEPVTQENLAL